MFVAIIFSHFLLCFFTLLVACYDEPKFYFILHTQIIVSFIFLHICLWKFSSFSGYKNILHFFKKYLSFVFLTLKYLIYLELISVCGMM